MNDLWQPLRLSLLIAGCATILTVLIGTALAYLSAHLRFRGKSLLEALLVLPLVLPPTVVGYFLLLIFGHRSLLGANLSRFFGGYSILFRPEAGILAAFVVSLPLLYLPAKSAFASVDPDMLSIARLMGANRLQVFWHVSLPLARRGIASGLLLAFARAIGEFGATTMVMGSGEGHQTLPIFIYVQGSGGDMSIAAAAVWMMSGLSLLIVLSEGLVAGRAHR
jgi:molybdate transport system permease protein